MKRTKVIIAAIALIATTGCSMFQETPAAIDQAIDAEPMAVDALEAKYLDFGRRMLDDRQEGHLREATMAYQMILLANARKDEDGKSVVPVVAVQVALNGIPLLDEDGRPIMEERHGRLRPKKREPGLVDALEAAVWKAKRDRDKLDAIRGVHRTAFDEANGIVREWHDRSGLSEEEEAKLVEDLSTLARTIGKIEGTKETEDAGE